MSDYFVDPRILVTVDLSREGWKNLDPFEFLSSTEIILLGLYPIKDQVSLTQARDQLGDEVGSRLQILSERFCDVGVDVDSELVFSEDYSDAIARVAVKKDCNAVLTWNQKMIFDRIAVLVKCKHGIDHVINVAAWLMIDQEQEMDLVHFTEEGIDEETRRERKFVLESSIDYLSDRGIDNDRLNLRIEGVKNQEEAIVDVATDYDALLMGETEQTITSIIFGQLHELVQEESDGPVLVVRNPEDH